MYKPRVGSKNADYYNLDYLTGIDEDTEVAVFEAAVLKRGDMTDICKYFYPTIGVMTMIDVDHTDKIRSFNDYLAEKAKIMQGMGYKGTLILNADDWYLATIDVSKFKGEILTFGKSGNATFRIKDFEYGSAGMTFWLKHKGVKYKGYIPGLGEHNVYNAVAAISAAVSLDIDIPYAIKRLSSFDTSIPTLKSLKEEIM